MWSNGPTNDDRAHWGGIALAAFAGRSNAQDAVEAFASITGTDPESLLPDLMCDLMHWADRNGGGFDEAVARAQAPAGPHPSPLVALLAALAPWAQAFNMEDLGEAVERGRFHHGEEVQEELQDQRDEERKRTALQAQGAL